MVPLVSVVVLRRLWRLFLGVLGADHSLSDVLSDVVGGLGTVDVLGNSASEFRQLLGGGLDVFAFFRLGIDLLSFLRFSDRLLVM